MNPSPRIVISASRRTDIPAFYMPWFMHQIEKGVVQRINPYNRQVKAIPVNPQSVHSIVFWSKNYGPFMTDGFGRKLQSAGYHLFFNFTINSESSLLEPNIPSLTNRLDQLERLTAIYGQEAVAWRFDPICFYETEAGAQHNLGDFKRIAHTAANLGVRRCITSFWDDYRKIRQRSASLEHFRFIDPPLEKKVRALTRMAAYLNKLGIRLLTCCENPVLDALTGDVGPATCIDHLQLTRLYGEGLSFKRDAGQRVKMGCGCHMAVDIGDYNQHPCYHNCLFCYANPVSMPNNFAIEQPKQMDEKNC